MILSGLEFLLSPLIHLMGWVFQGLFSHTSSAGFSVILLSVIVSLCAFPLGAWAQKVEFRNRVRRQKVEAEVADAVKGLKGEERFRATERVYESNGYHPISNMVVGLPFLIVLPFLLAALFLFSNHPALEGASLFFILDLSAPDGFAFGLNLLPFIMTGVTIVDAFIRFEGDRGAIVRFFIVAMVLFFLVYDFASGIVLYWISSNLMSLFFASVRRMKRP